MITNVLYDARSRPEAYERLTTACVMRFGRNTVPTDNDIKAMIRDPMLAEVWRGLPEGIAFKDEQPAGKQGMGLLYNPEGEDGDYIWVVPSARVVLKQKPDTILIALGNSVQKGDETHVHYWSVSVADEQNAGLAIAHARELNLTQAKRIIAERCKRSARD